ncbi:hypothetical protein KCP78_00830 [Salmonella enterica subsp. enterica]|nr:hypothetical protein KCP78_00830 [Salmonella enterica subsp. enterica]
MSTQISWQLTLLALLPMPRRADDQNAGLAIGCMRLFQPAQAAFFQPERPHAGESDQHPHDQSVYLEDRQSAVCGGCRRYRQEK